jgi:hypothetical protein
MVDSGIDHGKREHRPGVRIVGLILIVLMTMVLLELCAWFGIKYVLQPRDSGGYYTTLRIERAAYDKYISERDPVLGWPSPDDLGSDNYDLSGARPTPAFPEPGAECISLYGDSFTYGSEVGHEDAWSNLLSQDLGCRIGNFGVGAYGTDQALIRFLRNSADSAPLSILGILPHNIMRNVNQQRYFLRGSTIFGLKPRFVLMDGELSSVPLPNFSYEELQAAMQDPAGHFPHETFLPDSTEGPTTLGFPYTNVLIRQLLSPRIQNWLRGRPSWLSFLDENHASKALQITAEITRAFAHTATQRGKQSLVILFPTPNSMTYYRKTGFPATQNLLNLMRDAGIRYLDLSAPIDEYLEGRSICGLLTNPESCDGHFNREGNRVLALIVRAHLESRGLLPDTE